MEAGSLRRQKPAPDENLRYQVRSRHSAVGTAVTLLGGGVIAWPSRRAQQPSGVRSPGPKGCPHRLQL